MTGETRRYFFPSARLPLYVHMPGAFPFLKPSIVSASSGPSPSSALMSRIRCCSVLTLKRSALIFGSRDSVCNLDTVPRLVHVDALVLLTHLPIEHVSAARYIPLRLCRDAIHVPPDLHLAEEALHAAADLGIRRHRRVDVPQDAAEFGRGAEAGGVTRQEGHEST